MIQIRDLTIRYANGFAPIVGFSATLKAGQPYALVGENGSGKSTLARVLCGLTTPSAGTAMINGRKPYRLRGQSRLAIARYIPQRPRDIFLHPTVAEDIEHSSRGIHAGHVENILSKFELTRYLQYHPLDVPEPVAWRAALCMGYLTNPELLFVDEILGRSSDLVETILGLIMNDRSAQNRFTVIASHTDDLPISHPYGILKL